MESPKKVEANQQSCGVSLELQEHSVIPPSRMEKSIRCSSQLLVEKFSYTWKLYDFDEIPFICGYPIYSPAFYINKNTNCCWQIAMTKHTYYTGRDGLDGNDEGDISGSEDEDEPSEICDGIKAEKKEKVKPEKRNRIGFRLTKVDDSTHIWDAVSYTFILKTSDGTTVSTKEREEPGVSTYRGVPGVPMYAFLTEKDLGAEKLFNEKYLEVTCDIKYSYVEGLEVPVAYEGKKFVDGLRVLYVSNKFSDLLLNVGEEEHHVHKIVLHAAIPGLAKLLENTETPKTKFNLKLDSEVGKAMVSFMYCGKIVDGFPLEKCADLHDAAKLYGVDCLEQYCSDYFKNNLPPDVCRECLGINEGFEDCLGSAKKIGVEKFKKILAKEACSHNNQDKK